MDVAARGCSWSAAPSRRWVWGPPEVCPPIYFFVQTPLFALSSHRDACRLEVGCRRFLAPGELHAYGELSQHGHIPGSVVIFYDYCSECAELAQFLAYF